MTLVDDKGVPVRINTLDNKDKTYRVEFVASTLGTYTVNVTFANQPVLNSPFKVTVQSRVDASKVKVYGPAVENPVLAKHSTYLVVDCKEAGPGELIHFICMGQRIIATLPCLAKSYKKRSQVHTCYAQKN